MSQAEFAAALYVTRKTLARLEKGDPGVSLAVFATALFALGLHHGSRTALKHSTALHRGAM